ncbi:hypothetical protein BDP27DRAFT_1419485 [Rhodocollybia butyracea]|uniref:Uncharacterized protein n=1 Tax=Rhodocollybia butyracea TaxID=206335 RepID=A0A9P5PZN3_9AGAR|nr:hypothetical protein BDP27DRAFT_1419485 [Rhodocollybia butyracea]
MAGHSTLHGPSMFFSGPAPVLAINWPTLPYIQALNITQDDWISLPKTSGQSSKVNTVPAPQESNCFKAIVHKGYPHHLDPWDLACCKLPPLHSVTGPLLLKHILPDPVIFISPENEPCPDVLLSWLCIRPAVLWQVGLLNAKPYRNFQWHAMLEAVGGFNINSSQSRIAMLQDLKALFTDSHSSGIFIDADNITSLLAVWNGVSVTATPHPQVI